MKIAISVILCTHNPRRDYLDKVLASLKSQTLPLEQWECLLIDNASQKILSSEIDLNWHPQSSHIREEELGLTFARLRGIKEAGAEILVFVDDDNVLEPNYLEVALKISKGFPMLGAWGGQSVANFEETPPDWTKPYWWMLAIREFERDSWSNLLFSYETSPNGAGMCIRKIVAQKYIESICNSQTRLNLDAKGTQLFRCGDHDLAFTSYDIGLGTGVFVALKLTHLIPANRLQEEYLLRLAEGISCSRTLFEYVRGKEPKVTSWFRKLIEEYRSSRMDSRTRRFQKSVTRGYSLALQQIYNL